MEALLICLAIVIVVYVVFFVGRLPLDKSLGLYDYETKPFEFEKDYTKYDYRTTTIITESTPKNKDNIITEGEHVGRKYSKSNDHKRSSKKSIISVKKYSNKKTSNADSQSNNTVHVDIETYDDSSKSCAPSVSYRQSCPSPVESYSSSSHSSDSSSSSSCDSGGSSSCGSSGD